MKFELRAKPAQGGEWGGWFQTRFRVTEPGEHRLNLKIPETGESLLGRFTVKESNPELDNTRPDFGQMYQLASKMSASVVQAGMMVAAIPPRQIFCPCAASALSWASAGLSFCAAK